MTHDGNPGGRDLLTDYRVLLERYRSTLNLVSPTDPGLIERKISEATIYARQLGLCLDADAPIADLGTGSGLPGIVIACLQQRRPVYLIERRRRRLAFLRLAVGQLALANAFVIAGEPDAGEIPACQAIVAQAVGPFDEIYCATRTIHAAKVLLLSRKGGNWHEEQRRLERRTGTIATVVVDRHFDDHGRLVGLRLAGGRICRSSG